MQIPEKLDYLFAQAGAKRWLTRSRQPRANALLPRTFADARQIRDDVYLDRAKSSEYYLYSMDKEALLIKEELAEIYTREFPASFDAEGFAGANGVPSDFYNLRNISGYGMDPLPIPVSDNADLIQANKLANNIRPQDVPWLKELMRLFFGNAAPANLHIRKQASSGFPYFTNDVQYKKLAAFRIIENCDDFLKDVTGKRAGLARCLEMYDTLLIASINERQQPNRIVLKDGKFTSKPRTAPTELEAREGSYSGKTMADMNVYNQHGQLIEGHFAMRRRDVFGMSGPANYFLTAVVGCNREIYLNRFEFTYKTRDRLDKERKIAKYKYVVGSDVKTMDKMIPRWFTEFMFNELNLYWDERVVELARRMFQSPYVVPPPWRETAAEYNPVFGGDPLEPTSFNQHVGLPSGIAINPDVGKLWMTFVYTILYRDVGALFSPADLEPLLQGRNRDHALLDMSDDAAFLTNIHYVAQKLMKATSPYVVLEPEQPVIYLGDVFCKENGERKAYPNPVTYVVNALCREDSIDRQDPVAYAEGVLARYHTYSASPIFRDLNKIYEEVVMKHIGVNPIVIARGLARMHRFTDIDAMVRADPNVLYYKVDPKDVSPDLLDELVSTIPADDIWPNIKHLFKSTTR